MRDPTRLLRKQIQLGYWPGFIVGMYPGQFAYQPIRLDFGTLWRETRELNLYVHIPFCRWACSFCTFFKIVNLDDEYARRYVEKLKEQIDFYADRFGQTVTIKSICFGGGTPNAIPARHYLDLFETLRARNMTFDADLEASMEISPEILTEEDVATFAAAGLRRLSLGVQSLKDDVRRGTGRVRPLALTRAVDLVRRYGLHLNIDLINGIRQQSGQVFMETLRGVVDVAPESISIYFLSGADTSVFRHRPDLLTTRERYALFDQYHAYLLEHGYRCESHVKFVRTDTSSTHQQKICEYRGIPTLGLGCGARSYGGLIHYGLPWPTGRTRSSELIQRYVEDGFENLPWTGFRMSDDENRRRFVIYSFFLGELDLADYHERFGSSPFDDFGPELSALDANSLVDVQGPRITLVEKGRRYTDLVGTLFWSDRVRSLWAESG